MYLAIDIGGSKVLMAVFSGSGEVVYKEKFPTAKNYQQFLRDLRKALEPVVQKFDIKYCCCAAPGRIDRKRGIVERCGNLGWINIPLPKDISNILDGLPVLLENDAKLGALGEAIIYHRKYRKVLYITIGTGIGVAIIIDDNIDQEFSDRGGTGLIIERGGKLMTWEDIASGKAFLKRYGKKASEIDELEIWKRFSKDIAKGLIQFIIFTEPDVVIIGGGVGTHFEKFSRYLDAELKKSENRLVKMPPIIKAKRPEEAVIYGCYEFIKQKS